MKVPQLPLNTLRDLWPRGNSKVPQLLEGMSFTASAIFIKYGILTNDVAAIAMAQFSHECGAGTEMEENLNYTAQRIAQVWPSRPGAVRYAHDPRGLADFVYGSRMGNTPGTDDGWNYRGRGLAQTTGKEEYADMQKATGMLLVQHPEQVNDPHHALEIACANFIKCGCLPFAKRGDISAVTKRLNGGYTGLQERVVWTIKWRRALQNVPLVDVMPSPIAPHPSVDPKLQRLPPPLPEQKREAFVPETWGQWIIRKFF
jgi:putative chitinase